MRMPLFLAWASGKGWREVAERLTDEAVNERLGKGEWQREGDALFRELKFGDFTQAVEFVNRVAEAAEEANHHPDIAIHSYNRVRLVLSTHSAGGITEADFALAGRIDDLL